MVQYSTSLFKFILGFLKPLKPYIIGLAINVIIVSSFVIADGYVIKYFINSVTARPNLDSMTIVRFVILFTVWWTVLTFAWRCIDWFFIKITPVLRKEIATKMGEYVLFHSYQYFQNNFSGSIASKISELAKSANMLVYSTFMNFIRRFFSIMFVIVALYNVHKLFAVILGVWLLMFIIVNKLFIKSILSLSQNLAESRTVSFGKVIDVISNVAAVRYFANQKYEAKYISDSLDVTKNDEIKLRSTILLQEMIKAIFSVMLISVNVYALCHLYVEHKITIGDFSLILITIINVVNDVWMLMNDVANFTEELGICRNNLKLILVPYDVVDVPNASVLKVDKGIIEFKHVNFKYLKDTPLFDDLSLTIEPGSKVGLVGYSGSGKTTLINLILRLFDITGGEITIDSQDISKVTQESLRKNIAVIPQDSYLFHRTIMENIRYGRLDATDEEVIEAAKLANAHEFIIKTEKGYNSLVGEKGVKLSGGQRQRIAIARAILKDAPILILDEATSSLDSITEHKIQQSLNILMHGRTTICIAHRLSTLLTMDRIIVFDKGKIAEEGNFEELILKGQLFANLWRSQVDGYITV